MDESIYLYMYLLSTHVLLMNKRYRLNINLLSGNTGLHIYNLFEVEISVAESLKHKDSTLHMYICKFQAFWNTHTDVGLETQMQLGNDLPVVNSRQIYISTKRKQGIFLT